MLSSLVLTAFALLPVVHAGVPHKRCGPLANYYNQKMEDWETYNTGAWLDNWWNSNSQLIADNGGGFAGAFGLWAMGSPDWTCFDGGPSSNCDLPVCDNRVLNGRGDDTRPAYYVLESVNRLHGYFDGISEAFTTTSLGAALSKDKWAVTFYKDAEVKGLLVLREVLNALIMIIGIGASLAGLGPVVAGIAAGVGAALAGGASGATLAAIPAHENDTFDKSADLGAILGSIIVDSMKSFTTANNQLMRGQTYGNADIRQYIAGGAFLTYPGVDKNAVTDQMNSMIVGTAINQLYRTQKVFIMGGGACGDNEGIGSGPQESVVCRDGKAWYLYYWQANDVISTTNHQWGWVNPPPGLDKLGQGDYAGVKVTDIINSSLDAYNTAGYKYNSTVAANRALDAIKNSWGSPGAQGASWEGIFTIPVCDVGNAIGANYYGKEYILQPYGHESRPVWCGPICKGNAHTAQDDAQTTKDFITAANMDNFKSFKHLCPDSQPERPDPHYPGSPLVG
ncbi:hypothetical protein N7517_005747 [Penicillium concentricum]|uniref:Uncharacterized protein n=1 Tax=Penicillium concentricum TaxID=293559 RepID=A0A9W9S7Z3_9EURO|nr:uncharacterized protein N7517_005747 [Penicillium concentricum]KAJ5373741.1 hypothetical protein N7517_005747 [Penicillium concentricum]